MVQGSKKHVNLWIRIILIVAAVILIVGFALSGVLYYQVMNRHINTFQNSRGLPTFADYESTGLRREESDFSSNKGNKLNGYFYSSDSQQEYKGVIIVNNGFGSGHEGMLGEIKALTDKGYLVYGYDKTGYDESEGKGIGSISQGVDDLLKAIEHVKEEEKSKALDVILYGKSCGAYCCLAVLDKTNQVSKVVSMSAFNKSSDMLASEAKRMIGGISTLFVPFVRIYDRFNEKQYTACDGIANSSAEILIIHSSDDNVVPCKDSYEVFKDKFKDNANLHFLLYENKGHNVIGSAASAQYNDQMDADLQEFAKQYNDEMTEELWDEFLSNYDLMKCAVPDEEVMKQIENFLDK